MTASRSIANTADDIEIAGVDISPDPDLITYWLTGEIDEERGWGIRDDTFTVFDRLVSWGRPTGSASPTATWRPASTASSSWPRAGVAPTPRHRSRGRSGSWRGAAMSEERVRTRVRTPGGWRGLQEYLVAEHAEAAGRGRRGRGNRRGEAHARGPRGDLGSRGDRHRAFEPRDLDRPHHSMPADARGDRRAPAPVVAVSPLVAGEVVKGPTEIFMHAVGRPSTAAGVASLYEGLIDGWSATPEDPDPPPRASVGDELPHPDGGPGGRRALAERTLEFASTLSSSRIIPGNVRVCLSP